MNKKSVNKPILEFIARHHVLTLATASDQGPWCASCFYVYLPDKNRFIFTTDTDTRHGREMLVNPMVAAAIALETGIIGRIRGLQLAGTAYLIDEQEFVDARKAYVHRFPIALAAHLSLWALTPDHMKLTDNRLGFGKKLIWNALDTDPSDDS